MIRLFWVPIFVCQFFSCVPSFDEKPYLIASDRVIAVRGIPAEVRPNTPVRYESLTVSPLGPVSGELQWAYCTEARRAEERTGVSATCLQGESLRMIAAETTMLSDACVLFGPNTPPSTGTNEPARRPSDPDPTGGFYVPVRAGAAGGEFEPGFGRQRIRCDLAGATRALFEEYQARYRENDHPELSRVVARQGLVKDWTAGQVVYVSAGEAVELTAEVSADAFENYVVYSAEDSAILDRIEKLSVNWYVTSGVLTHALQPVDRGLRSVANRWVAPDTPGPVYGWGILRDDRGGASWSEFRFEVE